LSHSKQHAAVAIETFRVLFMKNHRNMVKWLFSHGTNLELL
jgi:hypothetical protein